ncbi:hypothetical protein ACEUZ9_005474 [Paracoccus litorisediminis]|uniref:hypothetical protein n=1 Tax=Paracoccus litorisediminis TaxID=2006130 RepID=UPI0037332A33
MPDLEALIIEELACHFRETPDHILPAARSISDRIAKLKPIPVNDHLAHAAKIDAMMIRANRSHHPVADRLDECAKRIEELTRAHTEDREEAERQRARADDAVERARGYVADSARYAVEAALAWHVGRDAMKDGLLAVLQGQDPAAIALPDVAALAETLTPPQGLLDKLGADQRNLEGWADLGMNLFADLLSEVGPVEVELREGEGPAIVRENYLRLVRSILGRKGAEPDQCEGNATGPDHFCAFSRAMDGTCMVCGSVDEPIRSDSEQAASLPRIFSIPSVEDVDVALSRAIPAEGVTR